MKLLTREELLPPDQYELQRQAIRARIITLKQRRRIGLGPMVTMVFENRDTLMFQIQEMIRVERILSPVKVQEELDVYNALMPERDELSATLLIEITDQDKIKESLDRFMGLDRSQTVAILAGAEQVFGMFEKGHSHATKISAVHFIRFRPTASMRRAFADLLQPVSLWIDHNGYRSEVQVPGSMREEWLADLACQA
ncbi:hypothetical protein W02_20200 [Nitrospira sp. KM1]|uniref:DUF3501 family protein n=1 Tax=Nitrospira sp. KM1 TaxID=1936990 RepID=UPI0013A71C03|nr:DUF3501 family protein [Nitrospira sp. KM1]BCA54880.1 hypothetical protein W02_20200 [Nitrospira sp. KM1]